MRWGRRLLACYEHGSQRLVGIYTRSFSSASVFLSIYTIFAAEKAVHFAQTGYIIRGIRDRRSTAAVRSIFGQSTNHCE